jgi:predicted N-acetyltransferase YhbS
MPRIEIRPVHESEMDAVRNCIMRSFSKDGEPIHEPGFFKQFEYPPLPHSDHCWAVFVEGTPVAALMLVPFTIQLEKCSFTTVGLTGVGTVPEHRHKGYSSQLIQKLHQHLKEKGFDGAVLHSAADLLYKKNGYEFAFCSWEGQIECTESNYRLLNSLVEEYQKVSGSGFYVEHLSRDKAGLDENFARKLLTLRIESPLHTRRYVKIPLSFQRYYAKLQERIQGGAILSILYRGKDILAYSLTNTQPNKLEIVDYSTSQEEKLCHLMLWKNLVDDLTQGLCTLTLKTYAEDQILHGLIEQFNGKIHKNMFTGNMATFFNPAGVMARLQSTFSNRLQNSLDTAITTHFHLKIDQTLLDIKISRGLVQIIPVDKVPKLQDSSLSLPEVVMDAGDWIALILGYISAVELYEDNGNIEPVVKKVLILLFPELNPVWDYYISY